MSVISTPEPIGLGTPQAESFISLMSRISDIYHVSLRSVINLISATADRGQVDFKVYKKAQDIMGQGSLARRLIEALVLLSGRSEIECTTFYRLAPIIGHGRGLISSAVRVCPQCICPESGVGYGMLAHQLQPVLHCPLHLVSLIERCVQCHARFSFYGDVFKKGICPKCGGALWMQQMEDCSATPLMSWVEKQTLELVARATDPEEPVPIQGWAESYYQGLRYLRSNLQNYSLDERVFIRGIASRSRKSRSRTTTLLELLRLASIQSVELGDLIHAPFESCAPRLLNDEVAIKPDTREDGGKLPSEKDWTAAEAEIIKLLQLDESELLPSKESVVKQFGLSRCGFWRHFPELCAIYEKEKARRKKIAKLKDEEKAKSAARALVTYRLEQGKEVEIRRDGEYLMMSIGITKKIAERALHFALGTMTAAKS